MLVAGEALRADANGNFVWLVNSGAVQRRPVEVSGQRDKPQVLVMTGLSPGDVVVRSSEVPLSAGQRIRTN